MIKNLSVLILFAIITISTQAQDIYSRENLEQASPEDLSLYLSKAKKMKKTGGGLLIAAPISAGLGLLLWTDAWSGGSESQLKLGTGLIFASLISTAVGIPVRITGSSRVKKVTNAMNTKPLTIIDIGPGSIYNFQTGRNEPGIKLSITF